MAAVRTSAVKSQTPSFGRPEPEESLLTQFRDHGCAHILLPAKTDNAVMSLTLHSAIGPA